MNLSRQRNNVPSSKRKYFYSLSQFQNRHISRTNPLSTWTKRLNYHISLFLIFLRSFLFTFLAVVWMKLLFISPAIGKEKEGNHNREIHFVQANCNVCTTWKNQLLSLRMNYWKTVAKPIIKLVVFYVVAVVIIAMLSLTSKLNLIIQSSFNQEQLSHLSCHRNVHCSYR